MFVIKSGMFAICYCQFCAVNHFEFEMIVNQPVFNLDEKLIVHSQCNGKVISFDDVSVLSPGNSCFEEVFKTQAKLKSLHLTPEENVIVAAMCIMSPGTCCLRYR